jgi:hypothetical protein
VLAFSHPQAAFHTIANATLSGFATFSNYTTMTFAARLPDGIRVGDVVINTEIASAHLRNVTVRNNRARGLLIKNRNTLIDNCKVSMVEDSSARRLTSSPRER